MAGRGRRASGEEKFDVRLAAQDSCKVFNATLVTDVRVHGDCLGGLDCECGVLVVRPDDSAALGARELVLGLGHDAARRLLRARASSSWLGSWPSSPGKASPRPLRTHDRAHSLPRLGCKRLTAPGEPCPARAAPTKQDEASCTPCVTARPCVPPRCGEEPKQSDGPLPERVNGARLTPPSGGYELADVDGIEPTKTNPRCGPGSCERKQRGRRRVRTTPGGRSEEEGHTDHGDQVNRTAMTVKVLPQVGCCAAMLNPLTPLRMISIRQVPVSSAQVERRATRRPCQSPPTSLVPRV